MKLFKIYLIFSFLFCFIFSYTYAADMNLLQNKSKDTSILLSEDNIENRNSNVPSTSTIIASNAENDELTTSDIINILLLAVGIVLILLAIAILIRCKDLKH